MAKDKKGKKGKGSSSQKSWEVDFDGYEEKSGGYDGPVPKRGTYDAELVELNEHTTSDDSLVWKFDITEGDFKGWRGWVYTNMSTAKWKTQQIVKAIQGGNEDKIVLDPIPSDGDGTASKTVKYAVPVRVRVINEKFEDETRAKIRTVMPSDGGSKKAAKKKKQKKKDDEPPF